MTTKIKHKFWISAPLEDVYKAISTIEGVSEWWTEAEGIYVKGSSVKFLFEEDKTNVFKIVDMVKDKKVVWECTQTTFPDKDWVGTTVTIQLSTDEDGDVVVDFEHDGWKEMSDFYAICNWGWGYYLNTLKAYCEMDESEKEMFDEAQSSE